MNMIERALERARKHADAAEVYVEESRHLDVNFESGQLKSTERKTGWGMGIRVIAGGRIGSASTTDPDRIDDAVDAAVTATAFGRAAAFSFPGQTDAPEVPAFDPAIEALSPETAIEEGRRAIDRLGELVPDGLTDIGITAAATEVRIANTAGLDVAWRTTDFSQHLTSVIVQGDSILWIADGGVYGTLDIRTDAYVEKIAGLAAHARKAPCSAQGTLPVIFAAEEMENLLSAVEFGIDAMRMVKGDSPLIGREGERVLGSVTLTDDPLYPHAPGSRPYDDEGTPSQRTTVFEEGVFRTFLFDLDTAARTGYRSTGNASRGGLAQPGVDVSNLVMSGGDSTIEDMVAGMDRGLIVHGVLGGGQSNLLAGDFALNIMLGFLVEHGEIVGRLQNTMVSGNVYEAFGDIAAMSRAPRQIGTLIVPDVMFSGLSVSGG